MDDKTYELIGYYWAKIVKNHKELEEIKQEFNKALCDSGLNRDQVKDIIYQVDTSAEFFQT